MEFIVGGYYLVQGAQREKWMDKDLLPSVFWTVSRCICEILPDSWIFTWTSDSISSKREFYRDLLKMDQADFTALQARFDELLENDRFGFPNVFFDVDLARGFHMRHLRHLSDVKLLSIALPETYWGEFIKEFAPAKNVGESGVRKKLREHKPLEDEALFRGFEVLGHDYASFCSFVCNSLEGQYSMELGISLNANGLIGLYEDAVKAADFTMRDEVGAEPYLWRPWLVSEYTLET